MRINIYMSDSNSYSVAGNYEYIEYQFDSRSAYSSPQSSTSFLNWPLFTLEQVRNIVAVKVISADIPFTYYTFNSNNNKFLLTETVPAAPNTPPDPDVVSTTTVTIPVGNYNTTTFITAVKAALEAASVVNGNTFTYTVTQSATTGKFTFVSSGTGTTFSFTFGTSTDTGFTNPRTMMGFNAGVSSSTLVTLVAQNYAMIQGDNYLYVNSTLGNGVGNYLPLTSTGQGGGRSTPLIACIPVDVNAGQVINWIDPTPEYFFSNESSHLETIDFYLTLGNNPQPIDLNGQPFKLKVAFLTINQTRSTQQTPLFYNQRVSKKIRF